MSMHGTPRMRDLDDEEEQEVCVSNLEMTIDKIGMGRYQKALLVLCGFGWLADNMWLEAIAIILPRVQDQYSIPDKSIGWLSSSIFAGMMLGAIGWGTCSDLLGRTLAFNATLLLTAVFGLCASFVANGMKSLCFSFFLLGTAIGGSMPTDGTLFIENIPRRKQHLLTALSVFFSFGAVLSAIIGLVVLPSNSCPDLPAPCDVATQNRGWSYLLAILSIITISMFVGRFVLFTLVESPRFLVNTGRPDEAVQALRHITAFNGKPMKLDIRDVQDCPPMPPIDDELPFTQEPGYFDISRSDGTKEHSLEPSEDAKQVSPPHYSATTSDTTPLGQNYAVPTPRNEGRPVSFPSPEVRAAVLLALPTTTFEPSVEGGFRSPSHHRRRASSYSVTSRAPKGVNRILQWFTTPLEGWWEKISTLLTKEYRRSTILIWLVWGLMSLAYTMFNVYLPKLLEARIGHVEAGGRKRALWDVVIFTLGGCPGALLGAWMIDTSLGRRRSLALASFLTAVFCAAFCLVKTQAAVTMSTIAISLAATTMWAILYGMTPNIFPPHIRGTACGTASALSRIGGMIAPILGGQLLAAGTSLPMWVAAVILTLSAILVLLLPSDGEVQETSQYYQLSH